MFQIDEVAELHWQFSCKKNGNVRKYTTHVCWNIQLTLELIVVQVQCGQLDEVAQLLG